MGIHMETTDVILDTASYLTGRREPQYFGAMGTPADYYTDTVHTTPLNTRENEFGKIVEPIPVTLKAYQPIHMHQIPLNGVALNGYGLLPQQTISSYMPVPRVPDYVIPSTSHETLTVSPAKPEVKATKSELIKAPPKKKWIKEYLEEEPKAPVSPVSLRVVTAVSPRKGVNCVNGVNGGVSNVVNGGVSNGVNGVVRAVSPPQPVAAPVPAPAPLPVVLPPAPLPDSLLDFAQEHSRPRTTSNSHGPTQIPSPPSVGSSSGSSSSAPRAGTREVHNKLEKNRRAHLKECFELLKRQLPATPDDKKCSNLSILGSAIRYIQVLRRKERECEHEMERLAREKIAAQQRLAALKREVSVQATARPRTDPISDDKIREEQVNGQVLGISIATTPPRSPPHSLNLSTKLRSLPIQITPTTSQQVRSSYGRHNTLTLTTLAPADGTTLNQNGHTIENGMNGVTSALNTLVHPAQIHLPISQVVTSNGLVVGGGLQLLTHGAGLRVLPATRNGLTDAHRIHAENGNTVPHTDPSLVVNGLTPIVVSQPGTHLLKTHTLTHKMVETQMVKGSVTPLTVSAQYLGATAIVKPIVVVSNAHTHT